MADISKIKLPDNSEYNIKSKVTEGIPYGVLDSTSTSTVMTATVEGITELRDGVCVLLYNGIITSATNVTLNINELGAKPIYSTLYSKGNSSGKVATRFNVAYTILFVYSSDWVEGGAWLFYDGYDSKNDNTIGYQLRTNSMSLPMTSVVYRYRLLFTSADKEHFVPANNSTSTNATASRAVCQDKIDPFGSIRYYGTTSSVAAGSRPGATALWEQYAIALGYSFNRTGKALTLTAWEPVYIMCAPQSDGSAIIDADTPYVQSLPTTEDGKIYIYLGVAYSATAVELVAHHPVYEYRDGQIRPYTNMALSTATDSTSTTTAATSSAVKTAYDLANSANTTANTALSGVNGNLIYDHTFTISNGVVTFTPHVYQKGEEVTTNYAKSCFTWKYRLIDGSEVTLTTKNDRGCDVTITNLGYGGHVIGIFTPA